MASLIRRGYGNSIDIPLSDSTLDIDFSSVNRAVFDLGDYQLDSDNSDHISIVPDTNALNEPVVIVKIQPGLEESIPAGDYRGELTVYDDDELSDGFVWIEEIEVSLSDKTDLEWTSDEYTIDHGNLGGLDDNDHPQYLTTTTADARYLTDASQVFPEQIGHAGEYLTTDGIAPYWNTVAGGGGGGVTDHGALTGLADDDHAQYHTDGRGDARYSALGHAHSGVYDPAGTASAAVTAHEGAVDPHPTYLTSTEGNAAYAALGHDHAATYAPLAKGVTNGDSHDHSGGDGAQIAHTALSSIGTNTHAQIDTHLGSTSNPHYVTADQVLPSQTGNSGKFLTTNATTASWAAISASADWIYASKTTTYTVVAGDKSYWLNCTNTFTLTFSAPATLGANWFCIVKNSGTEIITLAHTSGNIDGLTSYLIYPGDTRFVQCDGSTLRTVLLAGGSYTWTSGVNTFTLPPGTIRCWRDVQAGGGGGGSGRKGAAATARFGGVAGAGGARIITDIPELSVGVAIDVIVGAGGTGGASRTSNNSNGANGGVGGTSQCGTVYAYGGGNGLGGGASVDYGSGGGGIASAGASSGNGGAPGGAGPGGGDCVHMYGGGSGSGTGSNGGRSLYGGSGSCCNGGGSSGDSLLAGAAGGSGGGISSANAFTASKPGGRFGTWGFGGGGSAPQSDGSNGSNGPIPSGGGGGGYASLSTNAGNGGNGANPGGGGGGGGAAVNDVGNSGAGGTGGNGQVTVWYY